MKWKKTKYTGVRCREHDSRKFAGKPDRYFVIRYKLHGKLKDEAVGWSSQGINAGVAAKLRGELVQNIRTGKRPQSLQEKREMEAQAQKERELQEALRKKDSITFEELADQYIAWAKNNKKSWRDDEMRSQKHLLPDLGNLLLRDISPLHLEQLKNKLFKKNLAPATVKHCLVLTRQMFNKAILWNLFNGENPIQKVNLPKLNNKRLRFLTYEEAWTLLEELKKRSIDVYHQAFISLHTGMRFGEIAHLTWNDIDLEKKYLNIRHSKTNESRSVYLSSEVTAIFNGRKTNLSTELVFPSSKNTVQTGVSSTFDRTIKDLGWNNNINDASQKVVFHTLRHTFASWLAIQGTPLFTIKELMGHKTIAMTERYAHLIPDHKREAILDLAKNFQNKRLSAGL